MPCLTPRNIIIFALAWLGAFLLGSVFISNPFASEKSAAAAPDYWHDRCAAANQRTCAAGDLRHYPGRPGRREHGSGRG